MKLYNRLAWSKSEAIQRCRPMYNNKLCILMKCFPMCPCWVIGAVYWSYKRAVCHLTRGSRLSNLWWTSCARWHASPLYDIHCIETNMPPLESVSFSCNITYDALMNVSSVLSIIVSSMRLHVLQQLTQQIRLSDSPLYAIATYSQALNFKTNWIFLYFSNAAGTRR